MIDNIRLKSVLAGQQLWIEAAVKKLESNFVTIDIARREDGKLIIMALRDGQVSGIVAGR